ncbi:hypothetical protein EYF80_022266 [Liparis tanakae]|uniref:Uncharacterized protein n=1 Tax=Liparis tanakae TaxID=230148 RepID=A0A4Z2HPE1_9TELE|nr:hypothetical protein EYF80_022266 [Liparis tanakae]
MRILWRNRRLRAKRLIPVRKAPFPPHLLIQGQRALSFERRRGKIGGRLLREPLQGQTVLQAPGPHSPGACSLLLLLLLD